MIEQNVESKLFGDLHSSYLIDEDQCHKVIVAILIQVTSMVEQMADTALYADPKEVADCIKGIISMGTINLRKTIETGCMVYNS